VGRTPHNLPHHMRRLGRLPSKAQAEKISVADVNKDRMSQHVSAYEALDMLALKRRLQDCGLEHYVVGKDKPDEVLVARYIGGRWGVNGGSR